MTSLPLGDVESGDNTASYEELRGLVLRGTGRGSGLAVLMREGMAAWAALCAAVLRKGSAVSTPTAIRRSQLPDDLRHELATLMAQPALSSLTQGAMTA